MVSDIYVQHLYDEMMGRYFYSESRELKDWFGKWNPFTKPPKFNVHMRQIGDTIYSKVIEYLNQKSRDDKDLVILLNSFGKLIHHVIKIAEHQEEKDTFTTDEEGRCIFNDEPMMYVPNRAKIPLKDVSKKYLAKIDSVIEFNAEIQIFLEHYLSQKEYHKHNDAYAICDYLAAQTLYLLHLVSLPDSQKLDANVLSQDWILLLEAYQAFKLYALDESEKFSREILYSFHEELIAPSREKTSEINTKNRKAGYGGYEELKQELEKKLPVFMDNERIKNPKKKHNAKSISRELETDPEIQDRIARLKINGKPLSERKPRNSDVSDKKGGNNAVYEIVNELHKQYKASSK